MSIYEVFQGIQMQSLIDEILDILQGREDHVVLPPSRTMVPFSVVEDENTFDYHHDDDDDDDESVERRSNLCDAVASSCQAFNEAIFYNEGPLGDNQICRELHSVLLELKRRNEEWIEASIHNELEMGKSIHPSIT
jgi:hypothetical protein